MPGRIPCRDTTRNARIRTRCAASYTGAVARAITPLSSARAGNGLDADTEQLPWRKIVTLALAVPGLVAGFVAFALLNEAYTALLGDNARGQLAVPAVVVACLALTILLRWNWGWPLAGGVAVGSAVGLAGTLAIGAMFPSQEAITDKAGARLADEHLTALEQSPEFASAPPELKLLKSVRQHGCSDWFDRREPSTWRDYDLGPSTPDAAIAFLQQRWQLAGYRQSDDLLWRRDFGTWTATLRLYVAGHTLGVIGRDAGSHACK